MPVIRVAETNGARVVVLIGGYTPARGNMPEGRTQSCGSATLVRVEAGGGEKGRVLLVDVGREADLLLAGLAEVGVRPEEVDTVVLTHTHRDHFGCLGLLPNARVLASAREIEEARERFAAGEEAADRELLARVTVCEKDVAPGVWVEATPGHTMGSQSVLVRVGEETVVMSGDAVTTPDAFAQRRASSNALDPEKGRRSIEQLAAVATVIVPGHDRPFRVSGDGQLGPAIDREGG